jgi:hypothetical protein
MEILWIVIYTFLGYKEMHKIKKKFYLRYVLAIEDIIPFFRSGTTCRQE